MLECMCYAGCMRCDCDVCGGYLVLYVCDGICVYSVGAYMSVSLLWC